MPAIALLLAACAQKPSPSIPLDSEVFEAALAFDPAPPSVGEVWLGLDLADAAGQPESGCTVTASALMPEYGHGGPMEPQVSEAGDGAYEAEWICSMTGRWELTFDVACANRTDQLVADVDVD